MTRSARLAALEKLAYFGPAADPRHLPYSRPPLTVGQIMYGIGSPACLLDAQEKRQLTDRIVGSGVDVNSPAKRLVSAGIGALAGNFIANMFGAGPFNRGIATAIGAKYGYNK